MGPVNARWGAAAALVLLAACAQEQPEPAIANFLAVKDTWVQSTADSGASADAALADAPGSFDTPVGADSDAGPDAAAGAETAADAASDVTAAADTAADGEGPDGTGADAAAPGDTASLSDAAALDAPTKPSGPMTGICFAGLPASATNTGAVPMPAPQFACPLLQAPEWFAAQPVPPPTLAVHLGYRDAIGSWHALTDGDWVPLGTMMQGGFHLDLVPQVELPGKQDVKLQVQVDAFATASCAVAASVTLTKAWLVQAAGPDGLYTTDPTAKTFVVFVDSATKIKASCGIWLQVVWRVRLLGSTQWGQVVRTLRTYDGSGLAAGVPVSP